MATDLLPGRTGLSGKENSSRKCKPFHQMVKDPIKMILIEIMIFPGEA
jgi:hypothetical protein